MGQHRVLCSHNILALTIQDPFHFVGIPLVDYSSVAIITLKPELHSVHLLQLILIIKELRFLPWRSSFTLTEKRPNPPQSCFDV